MIVDARYAEPNWDHPFDICVIGAGAAGITLALEFAKNRQFQILVLEAGGLHYDKSMQALLDGDRVGDKHPQLKRARLAALGGSTQLWAGWCRPLDPYDFEHKDWVPNSGWPFSFQELEPYYRRANEVCGLGPADYRLSQWRDHLQGNPLLKNTEVVNRVFQVRRIRFNEIYAGTLAKATNIHLVMNTPVRRLLSASADSLVSAIEVVPPRKPPRKVRAKQVVLAAGGLENPRLLLLSGESPERAIGNQFDVVGRYFTEHGFVDSGWFIPTNPKQDMQFYFPVPHPNPSYGFFRPVLSLAPDVLARKKLLNAAVFFYPGYESHKVFSHSGVKAALELWEVTKKRAVPGEWSRLVGTALCAPHHILHALIRKKRISNATQTRWRLRSYYECVPSPDNRITLTQDKDPIGRPKICLNWRLKDQDLDSTDRFHRYLSRCLETENIGRLILPADLEQWRQATESGKHPMGTTRIHENPRQGVVDRNCKVHGTDNLYVVGSSVFPTVGYANPTLTLVALTIRLADHLIFDR